ncbi:MAG: hypothetical protein KF688_11670 [Pirellulales bacterium]|nr:hypothetical protein [Pirellulales bacterium]MBX3432275.1 hypothetical protein [Pirellulales bacterium]
MTLTRAESAVMAVFRTYLVGPGEMLCFHGPLGLQHAASLQRLIDRQLLIKESFAGGYSLTAAGFEAMRADDC